MEFPKCENTEIYFQDQYNGFQNRDVYIAGFDSGNELRWSTFFGGENGDEVRSSAFDDLNDRLYIVGRTNSTSTSPLSDPNVENFQQNENAAGLDAFIARFDIVGSITNTPEDNVNLLTSALIIFPNPTNSIINITFHSAKSEDGVITIFDSVGRVVSQERTKIAEASNNIVVSTHGLSQGTYIVRLNTQNWVSTASFIKLAD